jgi:hypothetical protein
VQFHFEYMQALEVEKIIYESIVTILGLLRLIYVEGFFSELIYGLFPEPATETWILASKAGF